MFKHSWRPIHFARKTTVRPSNHKHIQYSTKPKAPLASSSQGLRVLGWALLGTVTAGVVFRTGRYRNPAAPSDSHEKLCKAKSASTVSLAEMPTIRYDLSEANLINAGRELIDLLGSDRVSFDLNDRINHSSTAWSEAPRGALDRPAVVVSPKSTEEVSKIAKICHARRIPLIGYSGGTSLEGTLAAVHGGICVDFKLMNKILALNEDDIDVVVQPGVGYEKLNQYLSPHGLFFPPDPGPGAQIGGMCSQGCSGTNAFRYGTVKDWVLGLTVVLADGTIVKTRGRARKSSSGYNLTQLMIGSEGTLGLITEASLKLTAKPRNERVAVASFPSVDDAVKTAVSIVRSGLQIEAMELLDAVSMRAINAGGYCDEHYDEKPHLFLKFAGHSVDVVSTQIERVRAMASRKSCQSFNTSDSDEEAENIWAARKSVLWSLIALKHDPSDSFLSSDTAVPIGRLGEAIEAARAAASESDMLSSFIGHVGDGNFHTTLLYSPSKRTQARDVIKEIQRNAIKLDGTVTGEHGIGIEYRDMVVEELGPKSVDMMRQIKLGLDPLCILNPDKLFTLKIAKEDS